MFSYRFLLKQAWQITKKYKHLWFFGLFAAITAAGGSWEFSLISQSASQNLIDGSYLQLEKIMAVFDVIKNFGLGIINLLTHDFWGFLNALTILIITAIFIISFIWLAISSQGALINSLKKILGGKKKINEIHIRENMAVGNNNFWVVLGLNILIKLLIGFAFFIVSIPLLLLALNDFPGLSLAYTILFIIFIPLATGFALLIKYAISYQIFEEKGFVKSLEKGFILFKKHWLISLEMAVILFIISFLSGLIFALVASVFLLPIFLFGLIFQSLWLSFLVLFLAIILLVAFGSILTTFQISTWTGLFVTLKESGGLAKLERLFHKR
jgi:hypothetical protein